MKQWLQAAFLSTTLVTSAYIAAAPMPAMQMAKGVGVVKAIDIPGKTITLQHEAIPALKWAAMTMPFNLAQPELAKGLTVGQKVKFDLEMDNNHQIWITSISATK